MEMLSDLFLHIDKHLKTIIESYGAWTYVLLFLVILCETGLVVTPFLPGDSLLFAAGAFAALGSLNVVWLLCILVTAAVLGDTVNYWLGHYAGRRAFEGRIPLVKREHLLRTQLFYRRYGNKTIIFARFVPIVRTLAPFVAGVGKMAYNRFIIYNFAGGVLWISLFVLAGYYLGSLSLVQENFSIMVAAIILLSLLPVILEIIKHRLAASGSPAGKPADGEVL